MVRPNEDFDTVAEETPAIHNDTVRSLELDIDEDLPLSFAYY